MGKKKKDPGGRANKTSSHQNAKRGNHGASNHGASGGKHRQHRFDKFTQDMSSSLPGK